MDWQLLAVPDRCLGLRCAADIHRDRSHDRNAARNGASVDKRLGSYSACCLVPRQSEFADVVSAGWGWLSDGRRNRVGRTGVGPGAAVGPGAMPLRSISNLDKKVYIR